jgi:hypothetical protein
MILRNFLLSGWLVAFTLGISGVAQAQAPDNEKARIEALIRNVETLKDAKFIRNGSTYDAKNAAQFLRGKWRSKDKEIHSAADFIDKAATVSSTSGQPYLIRFSDGREMKCADYLKAQLKP